MCCRPCTERPDVMECGRHSKSACCGTAWSVNQAGHADPGSSHRDQPVCVQEGKAKLLRSLHCEGLVLGSLDQEAACSLGRQVQASLACCLGLDQRPGQQAAVIPLGSHLHR